MFVLMYDDHLLKSLYVYEKQWLTEPNLRTIHQPHIELIALKCLNYLI